MARGRHRAPSNAAVVVPSANTNSNANTNTNGRQAQASRAPTASPQLQRQLEHAADHMYDNNLKVLRRRDPTITSIIDQFSHICLYRYTGEKWKKEGFEGTLFVVEHQDAPHYGMVILNKTNTGDWGRRIYSEDELTISGDYLMYRFFPDYTKKRLDWKLPHPIAEPHRTRFFHELAEDAKNAPPAPADPLGITVSKEKGVSTILGLWMYPTDIRESLKDVLIRLYSYVEREQPYPEEYHYAKGHKPPGGHSRKPSQSSVNANSVGENDRTLRASEEMSSKTNHHHSASEVDKLFAKLQAPPSDIPPSQSAQDPSPISLLQALASQLPPSTSAPASTSTPAEPPRGMALLNSIFASVQAPVVPTPSPSVSLPPQPEEIQIVSPKPTSSALPQILNQDVIYSLLGLASDSSSRASSVAPSTPSSRKSNHRYEGDNEYSDSVHSDAGYSTSSTVADFEDPAVLAAGPSSLEIPIFSVTSNGSSDSDEDCGHQRGHRRVAGDVTPRVTSRNMDTASPAPIYRPHSLLPLPNGALSKPNTVTRAIISSSSTTTAAVQGNSDSAQVRSRPLVPFQADSDLWPYPRAPVDERDPEDSDVVELDFSDTRALSDPAVFSKKQQKQKQNGKRKSRRERVAERERERDAIEKSWDDPNHGHSHAVDMVSQPGAPAITQVPMPLPSPPTLPQVNGKHPVINGASSDATSVIANSSVSAIDAREALLSALGVHSKAPARALSRKQFVQEVLSLIYSDSGFVDQLYHAYCSQVN